MTLEYPTDETLVQIEKWDACDPEGLIEFIAEAWHSAGIVRRSGYVMEFITGGWSGNESLIAAYKSNSFAWSLCWVMSQRGGLHRFEIPASLAMSEWNGDPEEHVPGERMTDD